MAIQPTTLLDRPVQRSRMISRSPVFYGWVIWVVGALGMMASAPGQAYTVSLFLDHYIREFFAVPQVGDGVITILYGQDMLMLGTDMGRTVISTLFGLGTFLAALNLTWVGKRIDRYGNRIVGVIALILFSVVLMSQSRINGPLAVFLSFILIRLLGQGSMFLTSTTAIAKWWRVQRGWMMGLALVAFALFQRIYLPQLEGLIDKVGWRQAWIVLGLAVGLGVTPIWWLLMRNSPETYGLGPDSPKIQARSVEIMGAEENWTLAEARRTPIFWIFLCGRVTAAAVGTALVFHQVSIFTLQGHSRAAVAANFGTLALANAFTTIGLGRAFNRLHPGYIMATQLSLMMLTLWLAMNATGSTMLTVYGITFGVVFALGGVFDLSVWADLFGREHHGAIRGFVTTAHVIGTATGPVVVGAAYDYFGSYHLIFWASIAFIVVPLTASLFMKRPRKRLETVPAS